MKFLHFLDLGFWCVVIKAFYLLGSCYRILIAFMYSCFLVDHIDHGLRSPRLVHVDLYSLRTGFLSLICRLCIVTKWILSLTLLVLRLPTSPRLRPCVLTTMLQCWIDLSLWCSELNLVLDPYCWHSYH